jgi:protein SCO1
VRLTLLPHWILLTICCAAIAYAEQRYPVRGLVLKVDAVQKTLVVSSEAIPGYMDAMTMPYSVRDTNELQGLQPGIMVDFTLVVETDTFFIEGIREHKYQGLEPDPLTARRLKLLNQVANPATLKPVAIGESVPDFRLTDQRGYKVTFSKFAGKVVVLNFVYTRCALPNFCFRSSNNFGLLQERFRQRLGRDLVLLTVTFDPMHDDPGTLAKYASTWKADPNNWHFLTGTADDVRHVCELFAEDSYQDEGLMNHSLHTAIINSKGKLVANLEGNEFSAQQLGDFVQQVLTNGASEAKRAPQ